MSDKIAQEIKKIEIPKEVRSRSKLGIEKAKLEIQKSKNKWILFLGPALITIISLFYIVPNLTSNTPPDNPIIKTIDTDYAIDVSEPRKVVGFADNVFVGKVIKQVGARNNYYPETQFEVEVLNIIKGEINGLIRVNQAGGYEKDYLFLMEGDKLIEEGKTYLFATRYLKEEQWHTLIPVGGDIPINNESEKLVLIKEYTKAYNEEIPFKLQ